MSGVACWGSESSDNEGCGKHDVLEVEEVIFARVDGSVDVRLLRRFDVST
jgi:hypothetical protein